MAKIINTDITKYYKDMEKYELSFITSGNAKW